MSESLLAIVALCVAGFPVVALVDRDARGARLIGEAMLLGIAFCAVSLFVRSVAGIAWTRAWLLIDMAVVMIAAVAVRGPLTYRPLDKPRGGLAFVVPLLLVATLLAGYGTVATVAPIAENDFVSNWGMKARAFWEHRGIDWEVLESALHHDAHPEYPVLLPLAFDAATILRGGWDDGSLGLLYVAFAAGLLLVLYGLLVEETDSRLLAAIVAAAMVPFAASPWIGLAEGPFVAYATTAILLVRRALQREDPSSLVVAGVFLGLAGSIKEEGLPLLIAVAGGLMLGGKTKWIARLWPAVAIPLPWLILRSFHDLPVLGSASGGAIIGRLLNAHEIFSAIGRSPFGRPVYWIGVLLAVVLLRRDLWTRERFVGAVLLLQCLAYLAAYFVSPFEVARIKWSTERLLSHLTPTLTAVLLLHLLTAAGLRQPSLVSGDDGR